MIVFVSVLITIIIWNVGAIRITSRSSSALETLLSVAIIIAIQGTLSCVNQGSGSALPR